VSKRIALFYDKGAVGLLDAVDAIRSVAEPVLVVRDSAHTRALRPVVEALDAPVIELDGIAANIDVLARQDIAGVVTFSERLLRTTAQCAAAANLPFHDLETVAHLTDKHLQRRRLKETGVDAVRVKLVRNSAEVDEALATIPLPVVVKPVVGEGSRNTLRLDDYETARASIVHVIEAEGATLVEEYLADGLAGEFGSYVSVELAMSDARPVFCAITGKFKLIPPFREPGQFFPSTLSVEEQTRVTTLATESARALGVKDGVLHIEVKLTPSGPHIIEVNGRLGGFMRDLYRRALSIDLAALAAEIALGGGPRATIAPEKSGQVVFQHSSIAPQGALGLTHIDGVKALRAMERIDSYQILIRPGTELDKGVATQEIDLLNGRATSHSHMMADIDMYLGRLAFTFSTAGGSITTSARELKECNGMLP
jgi:biotin carboxylase